jgi:RNA polymerase subunit RPABC4/transcription elongation factor Spt4
MAWIDLHTEVVVEFGRLAEDLDWQVAAKLEAQARARCWSGRYCLDCGCPMFSRAQLCRWCWRLRRILRRRLCKCGRPMRGKKWCRACFVAHLHSLPRSPVAYRAHVPRQQRATCVCGSVLLQRQYLCPVCGVRTDARWDGLAVSASDAREAYRSALTKTEKAVITDQLLARLTRDKR